MLQGRGAANKQYLCPFFHLGLEPLDGEVPLRNKSRSGDNWLCVAWMSRPGQTLLYRHQLETLGRLLGSEMLLHARSSSPGDALPLPIPTAFLCRLWLLGWGICFVLFQSLWGTVPFFLVGIHVCQPCPFLRKGVVGATHLSPCTSPAGHLQALLVQLGSWRADPDTGFCVKSQWPGLCTSRNTGN